MIFSQAVLSGFRKYVTFRGRASRSELWWWIAFVNGVAMLFLIMAPMLAEVFLVATLLPTFAVMVRRLHDSNRGAEWMLGFAVLVVYVWNSIPDPATLRPVQEQEEMPFELRQALETILSLTVLVWAVYAWLFSLRGTVGENRFGPPPQGESPPVSSSGD